MSESRQVRRAATIHRKKLFGGRYTPEEYHAKFAFPPGTRCMGCNGLGNLATRFVTLAPLDEIRKRDPVFDLMASDPRGVAQIAKMLVQIKGADGNPLPYLRIATAYACKACTPAAERAAARGPSWVQIEINRGPGTQPVIVGPTQFDDAAGTDSLITRAVEQYGGPRAPVTAVDDAPKATGTES